MDKIVKKGNVSQKDASALSKQVMCKVVKKETLHITPETMKFGQTALNYNPGDAQVRLIQNGDTLEAIEVICPCGNKIEILCQYD